MIKRLHLCIQIFKSYCSCRAWNSEASKVPPFPSPAHPPGPSLGSSPSHHSPWLVYKPHLPRAVIQWPRYTARLMEGVLGVLLAPDQSLGGIPFLLGSHFPELPLRNAGSPIPPGSLRRFGQGSWAPSLPYLRAPGLHWTKLSPRRILGVVVFFPRLLPGTLEAKTRGTTIPRLLSECWSRGLQGRGAGGRGPGGCSTAVRDSTSPRAPAWPRDPGMVRAGVVGTHLPTSGLDIFGDLRKMNKRQVRGPRGGAPGSQGIQGMATLRTALQLPRRALLGPGFKSAPTHLWARVCAFSHGQEPSIGRVVRNGKKV